MTCVDLDLGLLFAFGVGGYSTVGRTSWEDDAGCRDRDLLLAFVFRGYSTVRANSWEDPPVVETVMCFLPLGFAGTAA